MKKRIYQSILLHSDRKNILTLFNKVGNYQIRNISLDSINKAPSLSNIIKRNNQQHQSYQYNQQQNLFSQKHTPSPVTTNTSNTTSSAPPLTPLHPFSTPSTAPAYPFSRFLSSTRHVSILGAPLADGQPLEGVDLGPGYIRNAGLVNRLEADGWSVHDRGDVSFSHSIPGKSATDVKNSRVVGAATHNLYKSCLPALSAQDFLLTLGGDHSIGIGSLCAVLSARPDTGIVWVDAHADINTPTSSNSKNIHGMVVAFLMNLENCRSTPGFEWMNNLPLLSPSRIVYIGLRDLDYGEKLIIRSLGIQSYTMHDVDRMGIGEVMNRATDHLTASGRTPRPIHLSFDIDSIDPLYAPSTGTRVYGGLTYREAYYVCEHLGETGMLSSMDVVEVNPRLDNEEAVKQTVAMAVGLIASAMGNIIL